jgi:hypothetical protein
MDLRMKPESTPTRLTCESSESRSTDRDKEANRVWAERPNIVGSSWTLDIPVSQGPPEEALLNVVMMFRDGKVRMEAVDIGITVEGRDAPTAYGRLIDAVSAYLEDSGDERSEQLRHTPDEWFRFVSPDQAGKIDAKEPEENALYESEVPDLDSLAEAQGVSPIGDIDELVADFWPEDEDIEDFMAAVRRWRAEGNRRPD